MTTATFEDFFRANYEAVEAGVRTSGAAAHVAADAAQEAFIKAYPRWWRIRHYRNPAAWVQRVAINAGRDIERAARNQAALVTRIDVEQQLDTDSDDRVHDAVATLPARQRAAVESYYNDGLSTAEAAQAMGISAGAVRFHLSEARSNLRPLLSTDLRAEEN